MLKCENVVKKYMTVTAVKDVSFEIERGRIYALLGPNGSGKTTLMKLISGLTSPSSGKITMDGEPLAVRHKAKIAYMPTEGYFYPYMTCKDVGMYYQDFFEDFSMEKYQELLKKMQLNHKDKVSKMSSGMMAKLKIAVTLARDAQIVLLDEPLNGIDIIARENIINTIISSAADHRSIILSSHLVDELEQIIDGALFMKDGELVLQGNAEGLRENMGKSIVEIYKAIYA